MALLATEICEAFDYAIAQYPDGCGAEALRFDDLAPGTFHHMSRMNVQIFARRGGQDRAWHPLMLRIDGLPLAGCARLPRETYHQWMDARQARLCFYDGTLYGSQEGTDKRVEPFGAAITAIQCALEAKLAVTSENTVQPLIQTHTGGGEQRRDLPAGQGLVSVGISFKPERDCTPSHEHAPLSATDNIFVPAIPLERMDSTGNRHPLSCTRTTVHTLFKRGTLVSGDIDMSLLLNSPQRSILQRRFRSVTIVG